MVSSFFMNTVCLIHCCLNAFTKRSNAKKKYYLSNEYHLAYFQWQR